MGARVDISESEVQVDARQGDRPDVFKQCRVGRPGHPNRRETDHWLDYCPRTKLEVEVPFDPKMTILQAPDDLMRLGLLTLRL
jgi:hypothetical protein